MVRIAGFHPADPGSSPGVGIMVSRYTDTESRYSSVGRAEDCSSLGHWFKSGCREKTSLVQWLVYLPSKQGTRVQFPDDVLSR